MKLKKWILISIALLTFSALFTSCDDDDRDGHLYFGTSYDGLAPRTDRDGRFSLAFNLDVRDVRGYSSYDYLSSIQLFDSYLSFAAYGDYRDRGYLTLWLSTENIRTYAIDIYFNGQETVYVDTRDNNYARFMDELFYEMSRNGRVRLFIDGLATRGNGMPIQFMDFDIDSESRLRLLFNRY